MFGKKIASTNMQPLECPLWQTLSHAYGLVSGPESAYHIPSLLKKVYDSPWHGSLKMEKVWFDLWSSLCHQGTIYTASIAALPHLVTAGLNASQDGLHHDIYFLPCAIEEARTKSAWKVSDLEIGQGYEAAIEGLQTLKRRIHREPGDRLGPWLARYQRLMNSRQLKMLPPQQSIESLGGLFSFPPE